MDGALRLDRRLLAPALAMAILLAAVAPMQAGVTTVFSCPSSGDNGNHDSIFNDFFVQNLHATNIHTVLIYYTTDTDGMYSLTLTAHDGSPTGPQIGATLSKTLTLANGTDTAVTWTFADPAFTSGDTVFFSHGLVSGPGGVNFNLQTDVCAGDEETVGTSTTPNGISVATTITDNVTTGPPGCVANGQTLCIDDLPGDKRFQITTTFATSQGGGSSGNGGAIPLASLGITEGGIFWFFSPTNPEMLIKVINGCPVNNRFWVFYSAGTNVGFKVNVTDTKTGHQATYSNIDLTPAPPEQDTSALTCP
jgi:hypothetical protein